VGKHESHTIVLHSLASTCAVSSVRGLLGSNMPGHGPRCAYIDCKKTTDKKSFGHVNKLSDHHCVSYSAWAQAAA
jgi:hypothetical protein